MVQKGLFFALFLTLAPIPLWPQTTENTAKPGSPSVYVVKKGDCLWNISKKVWGNPYHWPLLFAANEGKIHNPNLIYPGQTFTIPTTLTKEELEKATRLAMERSEPLPVRTTNSEGVPLTSRRKHMTAAKEKPSNSSSEVASSSGGGVQAGSSSPSGEKPGNTSSVPAASENQNPTAPSAGGSSKLGLLAVTVLVLGGGLFFWMRRRKGSFATLQQPKPLSSFPQNPEPPSPSSSYPPASSARPGNIPGESQSAPPVTPSPASPSIAPRPSAPVNQPAIQSQLPLNPPEAKPPVFTGTITSISTSQPPVPSKAEPMNPTIESPSVTSPMAPPPASPSSSTGSSSGSQPSGGPTSPSEDKPADNSSNPPPSNP